MESQRVRHDWATNIFTFTLGKSILLTFIVSVYHVERKKKDHEDYSFLEGKLACNFVK